MMKYFLNLDENNYVLSIATIGEGVEVEIELSDYDFSEYGINAHKWDGETLIFDSERYEKIIAEAEAKQAESEQPTKLEQLRADVDYIAVMAGVEL